MLVLRLLLTFIGIFLIFEVFSVTAVAWSFYESVNTSFSQLKYSSDTKARDILSILARVTESKMTPEGQGEMSEFFNRIIVQSEKDLDKFQITDIFLVSNDGALLSHSSSEEMKKALDQMKEMSEQEKQDLMKAAKAQEGASKQCQGLSDKMGEMAKGSGKEGMSQQAMEAAEAMAGQLSEMEMMNKDMEAMDAAMDEAMKQLGKMAGQCKGGNCNGQGEGEGEQNRDEFLHEWSASSYIIPQV